jgi:hypothetical protein
VYNNISKNCFQIIPQYIPCPAPYHSVIAHNYSSHIHLFKCNICTLSTHWILRWSPPPFETYICIFFLIQNNTPNISYPLHLIILQQHIIIHLIPLYQNLIYALNPPIPSFVGPTPFKILLFNLYIKIIFQTISR